MMTQAEFDQQCHEIMDKLVTLEQHSTQPWEQKALSEARSWVNLIRLSDNPRQ